MSHAHETGRLNLPFVGIATFGKRPYVQDWGAIRADAAILGAPFDFGTQFRAGARFGPRAVREASTLFSFGHAGAYDHEDDAVYLGPDVTIVDIGDADIVHTDTETSHANIETGVRAILDAGALPVTIGGDHSVNMPCIRAFAGRGDLRVLWGERGVVHRMFDPLTLWRAQCSGAVSGLAMPAGHFIPEELPEATAAELQAFFG